MFTFITLTIFFYTILLLLPSILEVQKALNVLHVEGKVMRMKQISQLIKKNPFKQKLIRERISRIEGSEMNQRNPERDRNYGICD